MGKRSTRENKNAYQLAREAAQLSREAAAEKLFLSSDRIERIEYGQSQAHPEEVLAMAQCYRSAQLCNYYCSHECPIGREYVPEVQLKDLSQITLELIAGMNRLRRERDRLVEITVDGRISENELPDFRRIRRELEELTMAADSLKLWVDQSMPDEN